MPRMEDSRERLYLKSWVVLGLSGSVKSEDANKIALSLHNPLIERSYIAEKAKNLPMQVPKVVLEKRTPVIKVRLNISDEKLIQTDIELESLAQTWSEHCKHTIFANPIKDGMNYIKDGLYKTYIKGVTNLIRKQKGKKDFCVSVFSDNSGGIIFDKDFLITHKVETHNSLQP